MGDFLGELKRRHIYQVAAAYIVLAWILLQLFNNLAPILKLPDWTGTFMLVLIVAGFPFAILFAWISQLAPAPASSERPWPVTSERGKSLLRVLGASKAKPSPSVPALEVSPAAQGISIAVLPFANMSGDPGQEFFSDGMTEEITSALAKVPNLRVVARTSAFQFKSQNRDIQSIGAALHAKYLIEGSVRKDGNQVRITAQLIRCDNGTHLWAENYNRELRGVFAVQEEIAQAIAVSLEMPLGLKQGEHLVANRSIDPESYQQFLRAKALVRARGLKVLREAAALLEQVVARNPGYAPAWALLGFAYTVTPNFHPAFIGGVVSETRRLADALLPKAEAAAKRAIELDAKHAEGFVALAYLFASRAKPLQAEEFFLKALELDPYNPDVLHFYSLVLAGVGRLKEAVAIRQRLGALEPFVPIFNACTEQILSLDGQTEAAIALLKELPADFIWRRRFLPIDYAYIGRYDEAINVLLTGSPAADETVEHAVRLLRVAPTKTATPQSLPRLGLLEFVYLYVGAQSRVLETHECHLEAGYLSPLYVAFLWHPSYAEVRKTERFKAFARKAGLVDYWRAKGWPDFCHPTTGDDFVCE